MSEGTTPEFTIDRRFVVNLKGKDYVTFQGVLDAATRAGLKSLTTRIVQLPTPENGNEAVVMARAEFADGRVFEDVGDASPKNCSPQIATAALRMASTRAKGRTLRDGVNYGGTLFEELPPLENERGATPPANGPRAVNNGRPLVADGPPAVCAEGDCGVVLTRDEILASKKYAEAFDGLLFCAEHGKGLLEIRRLAAEAVEE